MATYQPLSEAPSSQASSSSIFSGLIFDVDDAPMLQRRDLVMNGCLVQIALSLVLLTNWRRSPTLLVLQPFFLAAGLLGWYGAKHCKSNYVAAHFIGSAGLALVFLLFILAETFLKHTQNQTHANAMMGTNLPSSSAARKGSWGTA